MPLKKRGISDCFNSHFTQIHSNVLSAIALIDRSIWYLIDCCAISCESNSQFAEMFLTYRGTCDRWMQ
jgi:hypothetical protein